MLECNTYTGKSHDHTQCNEQSDVSTRGGGNQHRGDNRDQDAGTEHVLAAIARCQPASQHLCEQVAVEERAKNVATKLFAPFQLALSMYNSCKKCRYMSTTFKWGLLQHFADINPGVC